MSETSPIVKAPNKVLRRRTGEILPTAIKSSGIQKLILKLKSTLKNTPGGVGLAAPQLGESLRIFIVSEEALFIDRGLPKEPPKEWKYYVFINPQVKNISKKKLEGAEGCLSIPDKFGQVLRREKITVEAYDEAGKKFIRGASKFFARVIQHELDHLDGILFIDKASKLIKMDKNESTQN